MVKLLAVLLPVGSLLTFNADVVIPCVLIAAFVLTSWEMRRGNKLKNIDHL